MCFLLSQFKFLGKKSRGVVKEGVFKKQLSTNRVCKCN